MDHVQLTVLRGKLISVESGYALDIMEAGDVQTEAKGFLEQYPDMPKEERARCEALLLAGKPTVGRVL